MQTEKEKRWSVTQINGVEINWCSHDSEFRCSFLLSNQLCETKYEVLQHDKIPEVQDPKKVSWDTFFVKNVIFVTCRKDHATKYKSGFNPALPEIVNLLATSGLIQTTIASSAGISQSAFCPVLSIVLDMLFLCIKSHIYFPTSNEDIQSFKHEFF